MIDVLGWVAYVLVLIGFILNARKHHYTAMIVWICSDTCWIIYDTYIDNMQHLVLAASIITINSYGIYKSIREKSYGKVSEHKNI